MNVFRKYHLLFSAIVVLATVCAAGNAFAMKIIITSSLGRTIEMDARPEETIADVKSFVYDVIAVQQTSQRIYKGDKELTDTMSLASIGIAEGDTLHVIRAAGIAEGVPAAGGKASTSKNAVILVLVIVVVVGTLIFVRLKTNKKN